jgi:rhamnose utilization protein RhaD (predicted bifunctional aldolase and dehydrogenase)
MKCGLLPISQHAMMMHQQVTYHDYEGVALYEAEKERMAKNLGKTSKAMILRNHGVLALGETVREAFEMMYYLDCACQIQVDAVAGGMHNVQLMSQEAADSATKALQRVGRPAAHKDWPRCCACSSARASNTRCSGAFVQCARRKLQHRKHRGKGEPEHGIEHAVG